MPGLIKNLTVKLPVHVFMNNFVLQRHGVFESVVQYHWRDDHSSAAVRLPLYALGEDMELHAVLLHAQIRQVRSGRLSHFA
jgi:hypothetical protein